MVGIHDWPPQIDERLVPGHWEGDLIKEAYNRLAVGTLVERTTLFTVLAKMDGPGPKRLSTVLVMCSTASKPRNICP